MVLVVVVDENSQEHLAILHNRIWLIAYVYIFPMVIVVLVVVAGDLTSVVI